MEVTRDTVEYADPLLGNIGRMLRTNFERDWLKRGIKLTQKPMAKGN